MLHVTSQAIVSVCMLHTTSQANISVCMLHTTSQANISVCMQGSCECCPACVRIPELFVRVSTAVRYATNCSMMSHDTSSSVLETYTSNIGE